MTPQPTAGAPRRKRWLRFTLRTMLLLVTAVCVALGYYCQRVRHQQKITERIRENYGFVGYDDEDPKYFLFHSRRHESSWAPSWLVRTMGVDFFHRITSVIVTEKLVADAASLPHLQQLTIFDDGGLSDAKLAPLRRHKRLSSFSIATDRPIGARRGASDTAGITDRSLALMGELPALEEVYLSSGHFSAEGLRDLAKGSRLIHVHVEDCDASVTPSVAELFRQHSTVRSLYLRRTTASGEEEVIADWTR